MIVALLDRDQRFRGLLGRDFLKEGAQVIEASTPKKIDDEFHYRGWGQAGANLAVDFLVVAVSHTSDENLGFVFSLIQGGWAGHKIILLSDDPNLSAIALGHDFHFLGKAEANLSEKILGIIKDPKTMVVSASPEIRHSMRFLHESPAAALAGA